MSIFTQQVEADNQEQKDIADLERRELRLTKEVKELEQGGWAGVNDGGVEVDSWHLD